MPTISCPITSRSKLCLYSVNSPDFNIEELTNPQDVCICARACACVKKSEMDKNNSMTNAGKTHKGAEARHSWDSLTARPTRKGWSGKKQGLRFLPSCLRPCPSQITPKQQPRLYSNPSRSHRRTNEERNTLSPPGAPHLESLPGDVVQLHGRQAAERRDLHTCSQPQMVPSVPRKQIMENPTLLTSWGKSKTARY